MERVLIGGPADGIRMEVSADMPTLLWGGASFSREPYKLAVLRLAWGNSLVFYHHYSITPPQAVEMLFAHYHPPKGENE